MQWLAAKTPELGEWGRGLTLNGGAINTLRKRIMDIVDSPTKVLNKGFMMNMFLQIWWCTPTLQGILGALVWEEENVGVVSELGAKVLQFAELRKQLFYQWPHKCCYWWASCWTDKISSLSNSQQASWWEKGDSELFVCIRPLSYRGCPDEVKRLHGTEATNDRSKCALGGQLTSSKNMDWLG